MSIFYYLSYIPYTLVWLMLRMRKQDLPVVFYCNDLTEWHAFEPVSAYLPEVKIVSDNAKVIRRLSQLKIPVKRTPVFPKAVIMCRDYLDNFPCKHIKKVGIRYGAYHFIRSAKKSRYNLFDLYLFTSKADLNNLLGDSQVNGKSAGYPKLDPAFNGDYDEIYLNNLRDSLNLDSEKATVLLSSTWYRSELSAVSEWYKRLGELVKFYNVLVTLHPSMDRKFVSRIKKTDGVVLIEQDSVIPYIMLADVCVGDTGSLIAECCALDKPIITFNIKHNEKTAPDAEELVARISHRINTFSQLIIAIEYSVKNRSELTTARAAANKIFFDELDGEAAFRAAEEIKTFLSR